MSHTRLQPAMWVGLGALALALVSGGSYAAGQYDAQNADKVDGKDAVGAKTSAASRAGNLVATDKHGRVPDSAKLGGYTHAKMATLAFPPQAAYLSGSATMGSAGPYLAASGASEMSVSIVVPPDHVANTPLKMRVSYVEQSQTACAWYAFVQGLNGPDGPNSQDNVHNGGWHPPGNPSGYESPVQVPDGPGSAQVATFTYSFDNKPGMFIEFQLNRYGDDASDTCSVVQITGLQLRY